MPTYNLVAHQLPFGWLEPLGNSFTYSSATMPTDVLIITETDGVADDWFDDYAPTAHSGDSATQIAQADVFGFSINGLAMQSGARMRLEGSDGSIIELYSVVTNSGVSGMDRDDHVFVTDAPLVDGVIYTTIYADAWIASDGDVLYADLVQVPPDGYVDGTAGSDIINAAYTGDPDGDMIDSNDAVLPGATGDDDYVRAGDGHDTVFAGAGDDIVEGGEGYDQIYGGDGNDQLYGNNGNDQLYGDNGNDMLYGGSGDDNLLGQAGDDQLHGGSGNDQLSGGDGNDLLYGGSGNDQIYGLQDDDQIFGGDGDDVLYGGGGIDTIEGGAGDDVFVYSGGDGADTILDFGTGESGPTDDGDQTNNDFVDLAAFYNASTVAAVNGSDGDPDNDFANAIGMMRADQADGVLDGIIGGVDYTPQIGDIDLTLQNGGSVVDAETLTHDNTNVVCFVRGTRIATQNGEIAIEDLSIGDKVMTVDRGYQPIRWIGSTTVPATGKRAPIVFAKGAIGNTAELRVSPNHRVLLTGWQAGMLFGENEVLVAAKHLVNDTSIQRCVGGTVDYFHMLFDRHEIIFSEGARTESFHPGQQGWGALAEQTRAEILGLLPQLDPENFAAYGQSARLSLKASEGAIARDIGGFIQEVAALER